MLSSLFPDDEEDKDATAAAAVIKIGEESYVCSCLQDDGTIKSTLFANNIWNGAIVIAEYLDVNPNLCKGLHCCEVGAAGGLPSLVAIRKGAASVVITDYPSAPLLVNIESNVAASGGFGECVGAVVPHKWGEDCSPVLGRLMNPETKFDLVIASECLWMHDQHMSLLSTIHQLLRQGGLALVSFAHHVPGCEDRDLNFFSLARDVFGFQTTKVSTTIVPAMWSESKKVEEYLWTLTKV